MQLRAVLLLIILAALLLNSQQPTQIPIEQLNHGLIMQQWPWAPPTARSGCVPGSFSADDRYRIYVCAPDRNYEMDGHTPYLWIRLMPDPTFLPAGYLPQ